MPFDFSLILRFTPPTCGNWMTFAPWNLVPLMVREEDRQNKQRIFRVR
jgi:hypothetical protein